MAVSRAIQSGRLVKSVVRDAQGRPKISDAELADQEWAANTDYTDAPSSVLQRVEERDTEEEDPFATVEPATPPATAPKVATAAALPVGLTQNEASVQDKYWKAKLSELKFLEESGELVPAKDVEKKLQDVFRTCRTRLLGVPSRARQALPHLTVADIGVLERLVREALEELASQGGVKK